MTKFAKYSLLEKKQFYIDKTSALEKELSSFPSVYIEACAAAGKTTMVRMYFEKHADEIDYAVLNLSAERKDPKAFGEKLGQILDEQNRRGEEGNRPFYLVLEDMEQNLPEEILDLLCEYLQAKRADMRCIIMSRYTMPKHFYRFVWGRELGAVTQEAMEYTLDDVQECLFYYKSSVDPRKFYELTGGHAGCSDLMADIAGREETNLTEDMLNENTMRAGYYGSLVRNYKKKSVIPKVDAFLMKIRTMPLVAGYIEKELVASLNPEEMKLLRYAAFSPWTDESLCLEVWGFADPESVLNSLTRKGFLRYSQKWHQWQVSNLFREYDVDGQDSSYWIALGKWYEKGGFIPEAIQAFRNSGDLDLHKKALRHYYWYVPFTEVDLAPAMQWNEPNLRIIYLRAMHAYLNDNLKAFAAEEERAKARWQELIETYTAGEVTIFNRKYIFRATEIYLNLLFVDPTVSLDSFISFVEKSSKYLFDGLTYSLYSILGGATTFLCGVRDLTGLFACLKREENRQMHIWKNAFGLMEWHVYQLARIQYYQLTVRTSAILEEDKLVLMDPPKEGTFELNAYDEEVSELIHVRMKGVTWKGKMARVLILTNMSGLGGEDEYHDMIFQLLDDLYQEKYYNVRLNAMNADCMHRFYHGDAEACGRLLKYMESIGYPKMGSMNFQMFGTWAKAYILLNQYEKAERIVQMSESYLRTFAKGRFLAELLFQKAVIAWALGNHSQAMKAVIESFLISNTARYVSFYTVYGQVGLEVLNAYIDWISVNAPGGWHRKKKYNYGSVHRMPVEDYMEVILREAKRNVRHRPKDAINSGKENLTMMETLMLQCISRGLTNAQICDELNLKLSTVKSHLYSLYKKLGVKNRAQAMLYARNEENKVLDKM